MGGRASSSRFRGHLSGTLPGTRAPGSRCGGAGRLVAVLAPDGEERPLDPALAGDAVETVRAVEYSEIWRRAASSERRLVEVPFQTLLGPDEGPPTVLRGVIVLVFLEGGGWVIVDYKTDEPRGRGIEELVERYRPQILTYAEAWEKAAGGPVVEAGLYFTQTRDYVDCRRG